MVEEINNVSNTIAVLIGTKFKNKEGRMVSVWDAIKPNETGTMFTIEGMPEEEQAEFIKKLGRKIAQVKKITQGNYNEKDPLLINKSWFSKMVTMFRRYVGESYGARFEKQRFDPRLGRVVKGRYVSIADGVKRAIEQSRWNVALRVLAMNVPIIGRFVSMSERVREELGLTETDIANYRKNVTEFEYFLLCFLAKISLKESKEEKRRRARRKKSFMQTLMFNIFDRFQEDWGIGFMPSQLLRVGNVNVMPFTYAKKVCDFLESLLFNWGEDRYFKSGPHAGENITLRRFMQILPAIGPFFGAMNLTEQHVERTR